MTPIPAPVRDAGTYHVATGTWTRATSTYGSLPITALYRNDLLGGYLGLAGEDEILVDEGRLPGDGVPLTPGGTAIGFADRYLVQGFQFGYCHLSSNPLQVTYGFYNSYAPCTDPSGLSPEAAFQISGIPVDGCWLVTLDLEGTTGEFLVQAEGDGVFDDDSALDSFGVFVRLDGGQGGAGQTTTGHLPSGDLNDQATIGTGTLFLNNNSGGTGLGNQDFFWSVLPGQSANCTSYGGCLPCAALHLVLFGTIEDLPTPYCSPANANSVSFFGGRLQSQGGNLTDQARFLVTEVPAQPAFIFTGPNQSQVPFGCGDRCVGGAGVLRYGPFNTFPGSSNSFQVVIDMSVSNNPFIQCWYRDPANLPICGQTFNTTNGLR